MQIDFLDVDKFCENLPEITTDKIYVRKDFHNQGIFSQIIFGPTKNYTCGCGIYMGRSKFGSKCPICKVEITNSNERRKRYAKIKLPFNVINPIMYHLLAKLGKVTLKDIIHNLIMNENTVGYYYNEENEKYIHLVNVQGEPPIIPDGVTVYSGIDGAYEITKNIATELKDTNKNWLFIYDNLHKFYMNNVIVGPPTFRPTSKTNDVQKRDQLNDMYLTILNFCTLHKDELYDSSKTKEIYANNVRNLQRYVFQLCDFIFSKFSKKSGMIRDSILGKRNDFSARAVITPDPTLELDYCKVPYIILLELYKLEIANVLCEMKQMKRFDDAILYIDKCIKTNDYSLFDIVIKVTTGKCVILNRQPTLHRMGWLSAKIIPNKEKVIQIHPMSCEPYNADFDGDQMALYRALYPDAEKECEDILLLSKNLLSPSTGDLMMGINQDIVLGIYIVTFDEDEDKIEIALINVKDKERIINLNTIDDLDKREKIKNHSKCKGWVKTTKGRYKFLKCLPFSYQRQFLIHQQIFNNNFNKPITKSILTKILNDVARTCPNEIKYTLDKIKRLGLYETTIYGSTISLLKMKLPDADKIVKDIFDNDLTTIGERIELLKSPEIMDKIKENFGYSIFIDSGSRGSWDQAKQIILTRGYVSDANGQIVEEPIRNNYVNGLTRKEFFNSSYGTRKGLLDTALKTGESGYLTRKTVYSTANLELSDIVDCGTTDTFKIMIPEHDEPGKSSLKLARSLLGRYHVVDGKLEEITLANYFKLTKQPGGKILHLRSPIFCTSYNVCKTCYGKAHEIVRSKYIGIVAAQALGEIGTQLVMRTFHNSGVAQSVKDNNNKQEDIITDLTTVRNLLHNNNKFPYDRLILELYDVYSKHRNVMCVHFECIVSQMMRIGRIRWRTIKNRHDYEPEIISILSVPQRESWLLALAFHKPKNYLIDGILHHSKHDGVLEKIMTNNKI